MQNDRNSSCLVVHPPPSGNYTGEKNQNCLNTPGGFSCTSDISYLVPSCGCQAVSQGGSSKFSRKEGVFCHQIQGIYWDPILSWLVWHVWNSPCTPCAIPNLKHRAMSKGPYLPSACPLLNTSWNGKPGRIYVCALWFHIRSWQDSYILCYL